MISYLKKKADRFQSSVAVCLTYVCCSVGEDQVELLGGGGVGGEVSGIDATYIQRYAVQMKIPINDDVLYRRGDVDGDGEVTTIDATFIQRFEVRIKTPYPIGEQI